MKLVGNIGKTIAWRNHNLGPKGENLIEDVILVENWPGRGAYGPSASRHSVFSGRKLLVNWTKTQLDWLRCTTRSKIGLLTDRESSTRDVKCGGVQFGRKSDSKTFSNSCVLRMCKAQVTTHDAVAARVHRWSNLRSLLFLETNHGENIDLWFSVQCLKWFTEEDLNDGCVNRHLQARQVQGKNTLNQTNSNSSASRVYSSLNHIKN